MADYELQSVTDMQELDTLLGVTKGEPSPTVGWDDLRVSVSSTTEEGTNPPVHAKFKDTGALVAGSAKALNFISNSQGYINIPADTTIDFRGKDTSVSMWFRPNLQTNNNTRIIAGGGFALAFMSDLDRLRFYTVQIGNQYSLAGSILVNQWNHIVITYQEGGPPYTFTVYCNGIQVMQFSQNSLPAASNGMQIVDEKFFNSVDYISLWDKVLTEEEVTTLYNNGEGTTLIGDETDLDGLWKLNEGSGTVLADSNANGNDGSIVGGTEDTHWEWIDGHVGATVPESHGVHLRYFSPDVEQELFFEVQMPHGWKEGTEIRPHVHWLPDVDGGPDDEPRWGLEYTWANIGSAFTDTDIVYANTNIFDLQLSKDEHNISAFTPIDATGKTISSMLVCRIFRDATNAGDTYTGFAGFLEIDFHYQIDQERGSQQEYEKSN